MVDIVTRAGKGSPLTNNEVDANFTNLAEVSGVTGEPMGHEDRTTSTISFNESTRTFTIAPVSSSFTVWCKGKKVVVSSAQTVTIPNTSGMHSIYYDANGTLSSKLGYFTFSTEAPTAYVYWNATTGAAPYFGDERHGVVLDWQTHEYLHRTRGAAIANGFLASGYTLNNSATDAATQIAIESGTFFDEDMKIDIVSTATPTAGTYEQNLLFPAKIPVLHLQGTSWVMDAPTNFPFKQGTSRPQYNSVSGGVWSTADVGNNQHATTWILATNNLTYPVIAIIGQSATDNLGEAEAFSFADLTLTGFPSVEFRPLYKLIYKASDGYANSVNAQLVSIVDLRSISAVGSAANPATDHGNLSGLTDDDHPQYLSVDTVRGTLTAAVKASFLPSQAGNAGKFLTTDATSTSWAALTSGNITTALGFTPYNATNPAGYITGITSSDVTTALGFTPYNATNPSGFVTAAGARGAISVTGAGSYDSATGVINIVGGVTSFNTRTGAITLSSADVTTALGFTPYNSTNPNGYLTGITSTQVTTALGYTPYNSSNPSGYITGITSGMVTTALGFTPYNNSNPSGYITSSALSGYLTSASAASTYAPLTGTGASGTWGISISGNAATATSANSATTAGYLTGGDSGFYGLLYNTLAGDLNTYNSPGLYSAEYIGSTNKPSVGANGHIIQISDAGGTDVKTQWFFPYGGSPYMRLMWGNTNWGSWLALLTSSNYNSYSPTLTGTGASGTWAINITGSAGSAGSVDYNNLTNKAGGTGTYTTSGDYRAPIFYDSDNTGTYINPNGGSIISAGGTYPMEFRSTQRYIARFWNQSASGAGWWLANDSSTLVFHADSSGDKASLNTDGVFIATGSSRAPIFYDSNDTNYYVDPNSGSRLTHIFAGNVASSNDGNWNARMNLVGSSHARLDVVSNSDGIITTMLSHTGQGVGKIGTYSNHPLTLMAQGANDGGYVYNGSLRSPIFYDSNNTGYYADPSNLSYLNSILVNSAVSNNSGGLRNVMPAGGAYTTTTGTVNGAIVITLPVSLSPMLRFRVSVYTYDGLSFDIYCGGHTSGGTWYNTFAYMGTANRSALNVRFTYGGGALYVYIGELGSSWSYPQVFITDVQVGYVDTGYPNWDDNWSIGFNSSTYNNINATHTVNPPTQSGNNTSAVYAPIFYDSNDTNRYLDPAGTSVLNAANWQGVQSWAGDGSYARGTPTYGYRFNNSADTINAFIINNSGDTTSYSSSRAPIFYDSNDTGYYLDPNSTGLALATNGIVSSGTGTNGGFQNRTFTSGRNRIWSFGNADTYGISYFQGGPDYIGLHVSGTATQGGSDFWVSSQGISQTSVSSRAPIFYDSNNTGYYVDPNGNSVLTTAIFYVNGSSDITLTSAGTNASMIKAGPSDELYIGGNNTWQMRFSGANVLMDNGGYLLNGESIRSPLFYDSQNTAFYVDPAGTTVLNYANYQAATGGSSANGVVAIKIAGLSNYDSLDLGVQSNYSGFLRTYGNDLHYYSGHWRTAGSTASEDHQHYWYTSKSGSANWSTWKMQLNHNADLLVTGSVRAPVFYDYDNSGYYCDPSGSSYLYGIVLSGAMYFRPNSWIQCDTSAGIYWPNHYGAHFYPNGSSTYTQLQIDGSKNSYSGMYISHSAVNGMMYDSAGNGGVYREANGKWYWYYLLANDCMGIGTSSTNSAYGVYCNKGAYFGARVDGTIFYDANDTSYYLDPSSSGLSLSSAGVVSSGTGCGFQNAGYQSGRNRIWSFGNADSYGMSYFQGGGGYGGSDSIGMHFGTTSADCNFIFRSNSDFIAKGNVTAYSDERLKTDWSDVCAGFVEALAKVKSGTYTRTDTGARQAGVSAQSLQTVLPETVLDEGPHLAVAYGNAAMVSAVELAKEVVDLRNRVAQLESLINKLIGD